MNRQPEFAHLPTTTDWRGRFPFKIGAPSWVFPFESDNLVRNVEYLSDSVDRVQLLLFGKDHLDEMLVPHDLARLAEIRNSTGLEFSIHLPSDLYLLDCASNQNQMETALDTIDRIWQETVQLHPEISILHIDDRAQNSNSNDPEHIKCFEYVLDTLIARFPLAASQIIVENTTANLNCLREPLAIRNFGICADFGHLYHRGESITGFIECFGQLIHELHLHGFNQTGDHLALSELDENQRTVVYSFLSEFHGPTTLEIFQAEKLWPSLELLHNYLKGTHHENC